MTGKSNSLWTILVLLVLGIGSLVARHNLNLGAGDSDYLLTYTADFHARSALMPEARLMAAFPETTRYCRVLEQEIDAPEMDLVRTRVHTAAARKDIVLKARNPGQITCSISFRLQLDRKGEGQNAPDAALTPRERATYTANAKGMTATSDTARQIVNRLLDSHPGPHDLVDRIFREVFHDIVPAGETGPATGDEALMHQAGSPLGRAQAFALLCRHAKIPARLVTGFEIKKGEDIRPQTWVEVYAVNRWEPYDPENGFEGALDYNYLPVRRDGVELIRVTNSTDLSCSYSIQGIPPATRTIWGIFDLRRLPGKLKEPIKVVLILPIGALFTALVRTIIGIRTFGTFSPTLLALAFVYNDWRSGICIFFVVIATGFVSRSFLDQLKLLLVPRLGIILTMVVMLMVLSISVMNYFKWVPGGQTVLLPMVILTNLVERFYVTTEEDSIFQAMRLLINSVALALVIYLLLRWPDLGDLLFHYPELHFFTVAALMLMGRYTGYRLTELVRFRDLVPPPESHKG